MAYTRLLRAYYRREAPIPAGEVYRLVRATSKAQRLAVDTVLAEFFQRQDQAWHNKRADEEIAAYQAQADTNRRIARERTVQRTVNETSTKRPPNHKPEPLTRKDKDIVGQEPDASPLKRDSLNGKRSTAIAVLDFLNEKTGRRYKPVKANLELIAARLREGASEEDLRAVVAKKCREWSGDAAMAIYLRPATLFNATKFAQYQGELGAPDPEKRMVM